MLNALTSLRFIASFLVVIHHMKLYDKVGGIAVSFFFVLSGFILTYSYSEKFREFKMSNVTSFYINRFSRVYPLHLFMMILLLAFPLAVHYPLDMKAVFTHIFLLQTYFPNDYVFSFNGVSWSIANEFFFYAIFPFVVYSIRKLSAVKTILFFVLFFVIISSIVVLVNPPVPDYSSNWWLFYLFPPVRFIDFFMGMLTAKLFLLMKSRKNKNVAWFTLFEIGSIGLLWIQFTYKNIVPSGAFNVSLAYLPVLCLIVFAFAFQQGIISKILMFKPFVHLGEISYSTYMIHLVVIYYTTTLFKQNIIEQFKEPFHNWAQYIVVIVIICLSDVSYRYIEIPSRNFIRNLFAQKKAVKTDVGYVPLKKTKSLRL